MEQKIMTRIKNFDEEQLAKVMRLIDELDNKKAEKNNNNNNNNILINNIDGNNNKNEKENEKKRTASKIFELIYRKKDIDHLVFVNHIQNKFEIELSEEFNEYPDNIFSFLMNKVDPNQVGVGLKKMIFYRKENDEIKIFLFSPSRFFLKESMVKLKCEDIIPELTPLRKNYFDEFKNIFDSSEIPMQYFL